MIILNVILYDGVNRPNINIIGTEYKTIKTYTSNYLHFVHESNLNDETFIPNNVIINFVHVILLISYQSFVSDKFMAISRYNCYNFNDDERWL